MSAHDIDLRHMHRALQLAARGQGAVEPNPMVGCVITQEDRVVGEGWHQRFGEPHAEANAITAAESRAAGATMYVTLEPCSHQGKTPPCAASIIDAGIRRVLVSMRDPFPAVDGDGIASLRAAGVEVETGLLEEEAQRLNAPYLKLVRCGKPWVIAKWAMTLDGKMATPPGNSQWISNEASRAVVHQLRGRVDAILIGKGTADMDNPQLTARPPGVRVATRVVADSSASLSSDCQLVKTAGEIPALVAVGPEATAANRRRLQDSQCEVLVCDGRSHVERLRQLLDEMARRRWTNVLVEGGGALLGSLLDARAIDEVHVFVAPLLAGGSGALSPIGGAGVEAMQAALRLEDVAIEILDGDVYVRGRVAEDRTVGGCQPSGTP